MKRYPLIDIFRLLCAFFVVLVHFAPGEAMPVAHRILLCFTRQAVPFFFIVSGFFFARKLQTVDDRKAFVAGYVKKTFLFYGLWVLLLLPETIPMYASLYEGASWMYIALVIVRRSALAGQGQFWYVLALAETALIAGMLLRRDRKKLLYVIGCIGFVMRFIYDMQFSAPIFGMYYQLCELVFGWNCNFIMTGLPFFTLGVFLLDHLDTLEKLNPVRLTMLYLLVNAAAAACYRITLGNGMRLVDMLPYYAVEAILLFILGIRAGALRIDRKIVTWSRELSTAIYCLHNLAMAYILGEVVPRSAHLIVNYAVVIAACTMAYVVVKTLKIKPLYRLITLK